LLTQLHTPEWLTLSIAATLVSALRIMTIYFKWRLPSWKIED
jgi:uncharacterized membrane protein YeiH